MRKIPDDPIVERIERTGYGFDYEIPICPCCGQECEKVYKVSYGEIVGCDNCIDEVNAEDEEECFPWRNHEDLRD